jgi:prolyl oligopeptidase
LSLAETIRYTVRTMRLFAVIPAALGLLTVLSAQNADLQKLFKDYYEAGLKMSPEGATFVGRNEYNDQWTDWSLSALEAEKGVYREFQRNIARFKSMQLGDQDRLSLELLEYDLNEELERMDRLRNFSVVNHFFGPHLRISSTFAAAPANTVKDFEDRIARLRAIPKLVDGMIESASAARSQKMIPAQVVVDRLLLQLQAQASATPEQTPLLAAFRNMPATIPAAEQARLRKAASEAYTQAYQPAWGKYRKFIEDSYAPNPRKTLAVSHLPDGRAHYAFLVRSNTSTSFSPEQIHETGKREVTRILGEMAAIRKEMNFTGTPDEFTEKVLNAPEMRFKSEAEILAHGRDIAKRIDPELPRLFRKLPRMPYGVRAIPADRAKTAAPYYEGPALDGSRAGNFYLRTADPQTHSKCCMEALILHEAVPGHHLQIALSMELEGIPEFRRVGGYTAYIEGWGLYGESLGSELNMYQNPYERYGRLQSEILRALRLVVDTGLHHYGWTREQAVATLSQAKGGWVNDELVSSEVDRYIAIPGQALAYKMGELKIKELRAKAQTKLGAKFDVREFHDVVLRNGALPLMILEREVDRWLAGK